LTFYPTKNVKFANTEQENNEVWCKFHIEGIALDPTWSDDTKIEKKFDHIVPMFFFPLYFTPYEPRVVFAHKYSDILPVKRPAKPQFHFPLILNSDIPAAVFGDLFRSTRTVIEYDGELLTGIVLRLQSTNAIQYLTIELENNNRIQKFTRLGESAANMTIVIDTREDVHTVFAGSVNCTKNVAPESVWLELRPGINIFTVYYYGTEELAVLIEKYKMNLFEIQT
jgi:hypothetical protein